MFLIEEHQQKHGEKTLRSFLLEHFMDWLADTSDYLEFHTKEVGIDGIVREYFTDGMRSNDRDTVDLFCEQWGYVDFLQEMIDEENFEKGNNT